jgi:hypothetical protein
MDPDGDLSPGSSRPLPPQSNSVRRRDRRVVSEEVALPNSSRRASARKSRSTAGATDNTTSNNLPNKTASASSSRSKKPSVSSLAAHRSATSSSDRHHRRSSQHSTDGARSVKDEEHHRHHHHHSSRHHPSRNRSSRPQSDDDTKRRSDKYASSKSKTTSSTHSRSTTKISRGGISSDSSTNINKSRISTPLLSSSSKQHKHTMRGKVETTNNDDDSNNNHQVFYDEHGRKIKGGYHSSDFDIDSECDHYSSTIDGASDFDDEVEEEYFSDYIDGASELDDDDDEDEEEDNLDYDGEYEDNFNDHDGEDDIEQCDYVNVDTVNSDTEDDDVSSKEQVKNKRDAGSYFHNASVTERSNSPELNDTRRHLQPNRAMERNSHRDVIAVQHGDQRTKKSWEDESILLSFDNRYNMDPNEDDGATLRLNRPPTPELDRCNDIGDNFSQMSVRGRDPPEMGFDPPFVHEAPATSATGSERRERRVRKSDQQQQQQAKEEKKPKLRSILKKKEGATPPPIAFFGRTSQSASEQNSDSDAEDSVDNSGSDPDVSEVKPQRESVDDDSTILSLFEDKSVSTAKSGLRNGRFAAANAAAVVASSNLETVDDSSTDDGKDQDFTTESSSELAKRFSSNSADFNTSFPSLMEDYDNCFNRKKSHFLRTSDLGLTQDTIFAQQFLDNPGSKPEPHYHHPSPHPPPGVQFNCDENWISVDDGNGGHSPIAPQAVDALVATGYRIACDPMMWTPTAKTRKFMTENGMRFDDVPTPAPPQEEGGRGDSSCLVWSGKFPHKHYGHDLPVIRSQGIVNMSADQLVDLLMDSTRAQSYNVSSIGRKDELIISDGTDLDTCPFSGQRKKKLTGVVIQGAKIVNGAAVGFVEESDNERSDDEEEEVIEMEFDDDGKETVRKFTTLTSSKERRKSIFVGVTKIVRSTNKVPMRKSLEYVTLLHCRALTDDQGGNGFIIVGRAVTPAEDAEKGNKDVQRAEILLNVHIIRRLREKKNKDDKQKKISSRDRAKAAKMRNRCLMINVVHVKSPIIPNMLAKKVSLSAAASFISDIRALTDE